MNVQESLTHTKWQSKYHVIFIPKYPRQVLYEHLRRELGSAFRQLTEQRETQIVEVHLMAGHVHMLISIPPKYLVSQVMGYLKGKSGIHIARVYAGRQRNFVGQHLWARGYWVWVSTVEKDEVAVRGYIQYQEKEDRRLDQLQLMPL